MRAHTQTNGGGKGGGGRNLFGTYDINIVDSFYNPFAENKSFSC